MLTCDLSTLNIKSRIKHASFAHGHLCKTLPLRVDVVAFRKIAFVKDDLRLKQACAPRVAVWMHLIVTQYS